MQRGNLVVEEANDIGTAWLRIALLPANAQPSPLPTIASIPENMSLA
jgi:hypothetical protein